VKLQRRLASEVAGVGRNRIRFPSSSLEDVEEALTRSQVKRLVREGKIVVLKKKGISSGKAKTQETEKKD